MSDKLLPCPFCGLKPQRSSDKRPDGIEVNIQYWCTHQDKSSMHIVETGRFGREEYAVKCWNRRVKQPVNLPSVYDVLNELRLVLLGRRLGSELFQLERDTVEDCASAVRKLFITYLAKPAEILLSELKDYDGMWFPQDVRNFLEPQGFKVKIEKEGE